MTYFDHILAELKTIFKDEGVILFFIILPLAYPLVYSWIYNNEVAREVPVVIIDDSHSSLSREFIRKLDATPDVRIALQCRHLDEGKDAIGHGEAYGIVYFPRDFETKIGRGEQTHVGIYCDMSYMLTYKAIYQSANSISMLMGAELQKQLLHKTTSRDEAIAVHPLEVDEVPIFNVTGGYGNFIIPGVLVIIIQQAILLGVGMLAGTRREQRHRQEKKALSEGRPSHLEPVTVQCILGRATAYLLIFSVMLAWITLVVPHIFGFVSMVHGLDLFLFFVPYLVACVFFSMLMSEMVTYRESVMLIVVCSSLPLLFLSGVSWPQNNIPAFWQGVSWLFPSTFGVRGFVRMSSMGALLGDVLTEFLAISVQATVYFVLILIVNKMRNAKSIL